MKLIYRMKPPCSRCPYTLGQVHTPVNPCPQCRLDGYRSYEAFKKGVSGTKKGKTER